MLFSEKKYVSLILIILFCISITILNSAGDGDNIFFFFQKKKIDNANVNAGADKELWSDKNADKGMMADPSPGGLGTGA